MKNENYERRFVVEPSGHKGRFLFFAFLALVGLFYAAGIFSGLFNQTKKTEKKRDVTAEHVAETNRHSAPAPMPFEDDRDPCIPGSTKACGNSVVGECTLGVKTCLSSGVWEKTCVGAIFPSPEICGDNLDNDCNGRADDGCPAR